MKKLMLWICLFLCATSVIAKPIKSIIFLGDSLSDNGNLYSIFHIIPKSPPYFQGRFSNGSVWTDHVATYFQNKHNFSADNYAVGGACVVFHNPFAGNLPYIITQEINHYLLRTYNADRSQVLFIIWAGANDYTNGQKDVDGSTTLVVDRIMGIVDRLIDHGGQNFLLLNLPDLSKVPYAKTVTFADNLAELTREHNRKLALAVQNFQAAHKDMRMIYIDANTLFTDLMNNLDAYNLKYHQQIKNITDSCWPGGYTLQKPNPNEVNELQAEIEKAFPANNFGKNSTALGMAQYILNNPSLAEAYRTGQQSFKNLSPCEHPEEYIFWDHLHPSSAVHDIMSAVVIQALEDAKITQ